MRMSSLGDVDRQVRSIVDHRNNRRRSWIQISTNKYGTHENKVRVTEEQRLGGRMENGLGGAEAAQHS